MKIKTIVAETALYPDLDKLKATEGSAAIDLRAAIVDKVAIYPGQTTMIATGLRVWIEDPNYAGFIMARSGLASKHGLAPANKVGLIDSDYQGPLLVALHNHGPITHIIEKGERIAQLIIVPVQRFSLDVVPSFEETTDRGEGGFGSTGVK